MKVKDVMFYHYTVPGGKCKAVFKYLERLFNENSVFVSLIMLGIEALWFLKLEFHCDFVKYLDSHNTRFEFCVISKPYDRTFFPEST